MEFSAQALMESRLKIAELRNSVRVLKYNVDKTRFTVETESIKQADGNYGKNAEERERYLKLAINESLVFINMENELLHLQNTLEIEEAILESLRDFRREAEMNLKERIIDSNINLD